MLQVPNLPWVRMTSPNAARNELQTPTTYARERELVARIRAGDSRALEETYLTYKNDLAAFVDSYVRSPEVTDEIIQDLFLRIWQHRDMWECSGSLGGYLFRAARNRAISHIRHERIGAAFRERVTREDLDSSSTPEQADASVENDDLARAIDRAIGLLPPRCREAFVLIRRHHLTYAEAAAVMQLSVKTVEVQMGRAYAVLRRELAEWRE
jgi:RNA polymerase sigma-70 factor, ECF subfamily